MKDEKNTEIGSQSERDAAKAERRQAKAEEKAAKANYKATMKQERREGRSGKKSHKGLIAFLVVFVLLLSAVGAFFGYDYYDNKEETVAGNVWFMTADLGGLTAAEAKEAIDSEFQTQLERVITLQYGDSAWPYTAEQLGQMCIRDRWNGLLP